MALRTPAQVARDLRRAARRAARELAAYEAACESTDHFGTYRLAPEELIDERELLSYLRRARQEHPKQELVISVIAREGPDQRRTQ